MRFLTGLLLYTVFLGTLVWLTVEIEFQKKPIDQDMLGSALVCALAGLLLYVFGFFPNTEIARRRKARLKHRTPGQKQEKFGRREKFKKRDKPKTQDTFDIDAFIAEQEALRGEEDRPARLPAYALSLRSPFSASKPVSSWLGGVPKAPTDFVWPRDENGTPLFFIGQFDLGKVSPVEGLRPEGLPERGAMLVFITSLHKTPSHVLRFLSEKEVAFARPVTPPEDMISLREIGFWIDETAFPEWPVDLVPYVDFEGAVPPGSLADGPIENWLTTWGLAEIEADMVLQAFSLEERQREGHFERANSLSPEQRLGKNFMRTDGFHRFMAEHAPPVVEAIRAFRARARSESPEATIDVEALRDVMALRGNLADQLDSYAIKYALIPRANSVANALLQRKSGDKGMEEVYARVPPGCHGFISAHISGWRGHRLFGRKSPDATVEFDLRGRDCVIYIDSDPLLETQTEHESGFSIWGLRTAMASGDWTATKAFWHTNV